MNPPDVLEFIKQTAKVMIPLAVLSDRRLYLFCIVAPGSAIERQLFGMLINLSGGPGPQLRLSDSELFFELRILRLCTESLWILEHGLLALV